MGTSAEQDIYEFVEIIETDISSLCRLCGNVSEEEHLLSVYPDENAESFAFAETIMSYIPIKVSPDDILPLKICHSCSEMVERWHSFYMCCVAADKKFQEMLLGDKNHDHDVADDNCIFEENSEDLINAAGKETPRKAESEGIFDDMAVSSIAKAEYEVASEEDFVEYTETESEAEMKTCAAKNNPPCQHLEVEYLGCKREMINELDMTATHVQNCKEVSKLQCKTCCMPVISSLDEIECQICGETFLNEINLRKHILTHQEIICCDCNKTFKNKSSLKAHRKLHLGQNQNFACPICGLNMNRKYNMLVHVSSHNADFPCKICCASFNSLALLDHHKLTHSAEDIERYSRVEHEVNCNSCDKRFDSRYKLYMHTLAEHSSDEKKFVCHCGRILENEVMLTNHQKSHTDAMYVCNICNKKFRQLKGLEEHQNTHLDNRPYQCETCGMKFRYSSNLSQHRTMHRGVKNFICPDCGKKFLRSNTLATHLRSHKNIRKHVCQYCSASFIQSSSLLKHKRSMHRFCDRCGKMVGNRTEWQIHVWKKCTDTPEDRASFRQRN